MALNFPAKIYLILENESSDIIRWQNNGYTFRIVDHGRFEREIIPKYFRHNQISSVQRQLNLYGFKCINRGEDKGAFYHPKFRRGDWESVKKLMRYVPSKKDPKQPDNLFSDVSLAFNEPSIDPKSQERQEMWKNWAVPVPEQTFEKMNTSVPSSVSGNFSVQQDVRRYVYVINGRVKIDPDFDLPEEFKQSELRPRRTRKIDDVGGSSARVEGSLFKKSSPYSSMNDLVDASSWTPKAVDDYHDLVDLCVDL